jgi:hypothetical protein
MSGSAPDILPFQSVINFETEIVSLALNDVANSGLQRGECGAVDETIDQQVKSLRFII